MQIIPLLSLHLPRDILGGGGKDTPFSQTRLIVSATDNSIPRSCHINHTAVNKINKKRTDLAEWIYFIGECTCRATASEQLTDLVSKTGKRKDANYRIMRLLATFNNKVIDGIS